MTKRKNPSLFTGWGVVQQQICKPGSVSYKFPYTISIINLLLMSPSGFNQPTHPDDQSASGGRIRKRAVSLSGPIWFFNS
jgi:hypothetical protein